MIYVDDDNTEGPWDGTEEHPYRNITSALECALANDTIFVCNGTYYEHLLVDKTVSLIGENPATTVLDGGGELFPIIGIINSDVDISGFTVQNTMSDRECYGISLRGVRNVVIHENIVTTSYYGILIDNSITCKLVDNTVLNSHSSGIWLRDGSSNNTLVGNWIKNNPIGVVVHDQTCQYNTFYRNNFVNNTNQITHFGRYTSWDNGAEGNYWSDYKGVDNGSGGRFAGDGIGDTHLPWWGMDCRPLMEAWSQIRRYTVDSHQVTVNCNYTVASFTFNQTEKQISFYIIGPPGWKGFCNITVPTALLSPAVSQMWIVMFGPSPVACNKTIVGDSTLISFEYSLGMYPSENKVRLKVGLYYLPTANFQYMPSEPTVIEPVIFNDTSVPSPNGTIVWRRWDFGDGNVTTTNATLLTHQYKQKKLFNVTLTVRDNNTLVDSITKTILIHNAVPVASFTYSPEPPLIGETVTFNASGSYDPDGYITSYAWDFRDGFSGEGMVIYHDYSKVGTYNVTLTITDDEELDNMAWVTVTVLTHDVAVVNITLSTNEVYERQVVNISLAVRNNGNFTETFNVTTYATHQTLEFIITIETQTVTELPSEKLATLTFSWNTTNVTLGDYTISAEVSVVTGETHAADNIKVNGVVSVIPELASMLLLTVVFLVTSIMTVYMKRKMPSKRLNSENHGTQRSTA